MVEDRINWEKLEALYDAADRRGAHRHPKTSKRSSPSSPHEQSDYPQEWPSEHVHYAMNKLNDPILNEVMYCICRLNVECSCDHIANIFMRLYGDTISPFRVPFKPVGYVPNIVWLKAVERMTVHKAIVVEWMTTEREELLTRGWYEYENHDSEDTIVWTCRAVSNKKRKALLDAWTEAEEGFERYTIMKFLIDIPADVLQRMKDGVDACRVTTDWTDADYIREFFIVDVGNKIDIKQLPDVIEL